MIDDAPRSEKGKDEPMDRSPNVDEPEAPERPAGDRADAPGAARRAASPLQTCVLAVLAVGLLAVPSPAQESGGEVGSAAAADAPDQFRLSALGGWMDWGAPDAAGEQAMEASSAWGLDLETRVHPLLAFRLGAAYGRTEITRTEFGGPSRSVEANQIVLELVAEPRLAVGPLRETGVVPFGIVGLGSVIHDPDTEQGEFEPALTTRSQGSVVYGGGLEVEPPALGDFGARVEWRRADVQVQNIFTPTSREGTSRTSDRIVGTVYWKF